MLEYNTAAILESKMAAISGFISTYLGFQGGKEPNCPTVYKHYVVRHEKHFPTII